MNRPTIIPHWTEEPDLATLAELCKLLDLGLQPMVFCPPGSASILRDILRQPAEADEHCLTAWQAGHRPVILCEGRVPRAKDGTCHVLLPCIEGEYADHAAFLRHLPNVANSVRLHLFLNPARELERQIAALLPDAAIPTAPEEVAGDFPELERQIGWSMIRYGEHQPTQGPQPPRLNITAAEMALAVAMINAPQASGFEVSAARMRNSSKPK